MAKDGDTASIRIKQLFNEKSLFLDRMEEIPYIRNKPKMTPKKIYEQERKWHVDNWKRIDKWVNSAGETVRTFENVSLGFTVVDVTERKDGTFVIQEVYAGQDKSKNHEEATKELIKKMLESDDVSIADNLQAAAGRVLYQQHAFTIRQDANGAISARIQLIPAEYFLPNYKANATDYFVVQKPTPLEKSVCAPLLLPNWEQTPNTCEWKPKNPTASLKDLVFDLQNQGLKWNYTEQKQGDAALYTEARGLLNDETSYKAYKIWRRDHRVLLSP